MEDEKSLPALTSIISLAFAKWLGYSVCSWYLLSDSATHAQPCPRHFFFSSLGPLVSQPCCMYYLHLSAPSFINHLPSSSSQFIHVWALIGTDLPSSIHGKHLASTHSWMYPGSHLCFHVLHIYWKSRATTWFGVNPMYFNKRIIYI